MDKELKKKIVDAAQKIIFGQEGDYGSVNADDNGAVSVGKVQWHGNRALNLLKTICKAESGAASILGAALYREITTAASWATRTVNASEKSAISKLLTTAAGKAAQDALAEKDVGDYVDHGLKMGIEDPAALVYFADLENQGGSGASTRVASAAQKPVTLATLHAAGLADQKMGKYKTRRNAVNTAAGALNFGTQQQTGGKQTMTEQELRQLVADIMLTWVGGVRGGPQHREILNIYNTFRPLARGYTVQPNDAYCATTTSAAYIKAGIAAYIGTECGVENYVKIAQKKGIWVENDAHRPGIGDACVYDWDDNGAGDDTGYSDHIGIVLETYADGFLVGEGNMSGGKIGTRRIAYNGRYIRGFICPDFAAIAKALGGTSGGGTQKPAAPQEPAQSGSTYTVKAGDTLSSIAAKYGTTYQALAAYNGISDPNVIRVGQVLKIPQNGQQAATERTHTVKKGESLWSIAAKELGNGSRYNEIMKLNGLSGSTIHPGQVLKLPV